VREATAAARTEEPAAMIGAVAKQTTTAVETKEAPNAMLDPKVVAEKTATTVESSGAGSGGPRAT
jgi:hypothetical protein